MTQAPNAASPARRFGAPRAASVPKIENVRVTAPDLARRAVLEKTRGRLVLAGMCFVALYLAVDLRLAWVTVLSPKLPKPAEVEQAQMPMAAPVMKAAAPIAPAAAAPIDSPHARRAMITDRNGEVLALSLPTASVIADPRMILDAADAAHKLKSVLPQIDEQATAARLTDRTKKFVYIERQVSPRDELAINRLGIPGIDFERTEKRRYPMGRMAAQILGGKVKLVKKGP